MAKRKPRYIKNTEIEIEKQKNLETGGIGKSILIIVEGLTEKNYFEGLKKNTILKNQLAGVNIEIKNSLVEMLWFAMEQHFNYEKIWLVFDNDKRNAFILDKNTFFNLEKKLPNLIFEKIKNAYQENYYNYFLSRYDYLQWLKSVLGTNDALEYWDIIQTITPKNKDFENFESKNPYKPFLESELFKSKQTEKYTSINTHKARKFDVDWKNYTEKAYSCIAFEFWLILHFEQNKNAFLWVEKEKSENIDAFTYYRNKWRADYVKGDEHVKKSETKKGKKEVFQCVAYTSLLENYERLLDEITVDEQYEILLKVITAYRNALWLQREMQPILERQNYKWYEVNPYVDGLEKLVAELLNIKNSCEEISYFELGLKFNFSNNLLLLEIQNDNSSSLILNNHAKKSFVIRNFKNKTFEPENIATVQIQRGEHKIIEIRYAIPIIEQQNLMLHFKDFRSRIKSSELIVLL